MQLNSGVYIISYNNKNYVGSSSNLKKRIREHFSCLKKNTHPNKRLQNAYNKYGEIYFSYKIVATCPSEYLIKLEQKVKVITQKHNELAETVNELKTKVETYSDKINELEQRVHQLENASQS